MLSRNIFSIGKKRYDLFKNDSRLLLKQHSKIITYSNELKSNLIKPNNKEIFLKKINDKQAFESIDKKYKW